MRTKESTQQVADDVAPAGDPVVGTEQTLLILLFNRYRHALFRHVTRLVRSREDAAELVQETYLRVMQHPPTAELESAARAYLFQTATNLVRDHFRRQRFRAHERLDELNERQLAPATGSPEEITLWGQALDAVTVALRSLPPETQAVFRRARLDNQPYAAIARDLDISVRTVERRMSEAMELLASHLDGVL